MALRDLLARFDVDTGQATTKLRQFSSGLGAIKGQFLAMGAALAGAFAVRHLTNFLKEQIDVGDELDKTSRKLGVGIEDLQKFRYAADLAGVSSEQAGVALGYLNKSIGDALTGSKEQAQIFTRLGVSLKGADGQVRSLSNVIPDLADAFAKLPSHQEKAATAMRLFGRQGMSLLPLFENGSADLLALNKQFDELGLGIDQDFVKKSADAKDALATMYRGFGALKTRIAIEVLPTITAWSGKLSHGIAWLIRLSKQTHIVKEALVALGIASTIAGARGLLTFGKFLGILPQGKASLGQMLFQFGKMGLIIGLVAALALIFEDLWVGINGGQSVIRDWLNETLGVEETNQLFQQFKETADEVAQAFKDMGPELKALLKDLLKLAAEVGPAVASAFVFIVKLLASGISLLSAFARSIGATVSAVHKLVKGDNSGIDSLGSTIGGFVDRAGDRVFGAGGFFGDKSTPNVNRTREAFVPGNTVNAKVEQKNNIDITVQGGATNAETGRAVAGAVRGALPQSDLNAALAGVATGAGDED